MHLDELLVLAQLLVDRLEDAGRGQLVLVVAQAPLERGARALVSRLETRGSPGRPRWRPPASPRCCSRICPRRYLRSTHSRASLSWSTRTSSRDTMSASSAQRWLRSRMRSRARSARRLVALLLEDLAVGGDRLVVVAQLLFVELADLELDVAALGPVQGQLELLLIDVEQLARSSACPGAGARARRPRRRRGCRAREWRGWSPAPGRSRPARAPGPRATTFISGRAWARSSNFWAEAW